MRHNISCATALLHDVCKYRYYYYYYANNVILAAREVCVARTTIGFAFVRIAASGGNPSSHDIRHDVLFYQAVLLNAVHL